MTDSEGGRDDRATQHRRVTTGARPSRRRLLRAAAGVALAGGVAGCSSLGGGGSSGDSGDGGGSGDATDGPGGTTDSGGTTGASGTTADTTAETTDDSGDDATTSEGTDDGGGDGDDGTADPSTVTFDRRWQEEFDFDQRISSRNFGAAATPEGVFLGGEWGLAGLGLDDGSRMWTTQEWDGFVDVHADAEGVFAYTNSFEVVSYDPASGGERWRASANGSEDAFFGTALAPSYFVAESGEGIGVYDRGSGEVVAEVAVEGRTVGLFASDDVLVVSKAGSSSTTTAYDLPGGGERWRTELNLGPGATLADGRLVGLERGFDSDTLTALDLDDGERLWTAEGVESGSPVAVEDGVAVWMVDGDIGDGSTLYAHGTEDGTQLWSKNVRRVQTAFAAIDSGVVVAPATTENNRAKIRAYGAQSGERLAETDGGLSVAEAAAVDRTFLEIELSSVTAFGF